MSLERTNSSSSNTRPSFRHSKTLPVLAASFCASSSKGLRRVSSLCKRKSYDAPSASASSPSQCTTECRRSPNTATILCKRKSYDASSASASSPSQCTTERRPSLNTVTISPPSIKRALSMPAPVRTLRSTALTTFSEIKTACERPRRRSSVASVESVSSVSSVSTTSSSGLTSSSDSTSTRRRRRSSASSVSSYSSTEEKMPTSVLLRAYPCAFFWFFFSLMGMLALQVFPNIAPEKPTRKLRTPPNQREIILSDERLRNAPSAPEPKSASHVSRAANVAFFSAPVTSRPKPVRMPTPRPVDLRTFSAMEMPLAVDTSPDAPSLPKGPGPAVRPPYAFRWRTRWSRLLPTVKEEPAENMNAASSPVR